jgi:hypothetical protein
MGARLEAAKAAVDEVMQLATDTVAFAAAGEQERFLPLFGQLVTKARAARAALELVLDAEDAATPQPQPPEADPEDFGNAALMSPGSPVPYRTDPPKPRERGGPRDADQGPGVFKEAMGPGGLGTSRIQQGMRPHCEECGRLLDIGRQDPCPLPNCPHPGPIQPRAA